MDNDTKVILSLSELAMATDKNIILTKRAIIEKASAMFCNQIPHIKNVFENVVKYDQVLAASIPKISKGENYKGLPYLIMDYPATFSNEHIFAVRTMFWWGNFISITLHLRGLYKERLLDCILKALTGNDGFYISLSDKEWDHDFESDNYQSIQVLTPEIIAKLEKQNFIKIALKYELHHWNMMQSMLPDGYKKLAKILRF